MEYRRIWIREKWFRWDDNEERLEEKRKEEKMGMKQEEGKEKKQVEERDRAEGR